MKGSSMRKSTISAAVMIGTVALVAGVAMPANAATSGDTSATVTVEGGVLSVTVPTSLTLDTTDATAIKPGSAVTADATITVDDERNGTTGWATTVSIGAFVGDLGGNSIAPTDVAVTPDDSNNVQTGTLTPTSANASALGLTPQTIQTASAVSGINTLSWSEAVSLTIPNDALAENYTATLTHSVS
jgi:hypothetical protein